MDVEGLAHHLTHSKQVILALKSVVAERELQVERKIRLGPKCWR